jgi:hypothetical protein
MDGERSIDTAIKASPLALAEQASRQAQDHAQIAESLFELMSRVQSSGTWIPCIDSLCSPPPGMLRRRWRFLVRLHTHDITIKRDRSVYIGCVMLQR